MFANRHLHWCPLPQQLYCGTLLTLAVVMGLPAEWVLEDLPAAA